MNIPQAVLGAISLRAQQYDYLFSFDRQPQTPEDVADHLKRDVGYEKLQYVESVAALCSAAEPCLLEPVTAGKRKDLGDRAPFDAPYRLNISESNWRLYNPDGQLINVIDYREMLIKEILKLKPG
jgi:hypothetical protein